MSINLLADKPVMVAGIGLHRYQRVSESPFVEIGLVAIREALSDAGLAWSQVQSAYVGTSYLGMATGPTMLQYLGRTGIPIVQVESASATGSVAFRQACIDVAAGLVDVAIAVGVDKPAHVPTAPDRLALPTLTEQPVTFPEHFALLTQRYLDTTGARAEEIAHVAVKNHRHGALNPFAQRQQERTLEEVLAPPNVAGVLTRLQCTSVGEGAAAAIVVSQEAAARLVPHQIPVRVKASAYGSEMAGDQVRTEEAVTRRTAAQAYEMAGVGPDDIDVVELHDAFSVEELVYLEALGVCEAGKALPRLLEGELGIGGTVAVSPSGGLLAMGHPGGPTGVGQICEIVRQLRGQAGPRQHTRPRVGLAHMVGVGGVAAVHILSTA